MRLKADLTLFAVSIIWGTAFIAQNAAGQYQTAYLFNAASFLLGALVLVPFLPRGQRIPAGQWKWMAVAGLVLFIAAALQQFGIMHTRVANAGFLTSLYAVFTPFLLWLSFKEKPHLLDVAAILLASIGAYLLSTNAEGWSFQIGDLLVTIGALFWAVHLIILGKFASRYPPVSFSAGQFLLSGLFNLAVGLMVETPLTLLNLTVLGATLYRGLLSIGLGYTLQVWGQNHTPPTDAAILFSMEAVFAALAGWLLLHQTLQPIQILGCALIFGAVLLSQLKHHPAS